MRNIPNDYCTLSPFPFLTKFPSVLNFMSVQYLKGHWSVEDIVLKRLMALCSAAYFLCLSSIPLTFMEIINISQKMLLFLHGV